MNHEIPHYSRSRKYYVNVNILWMRHKFVIISIIKDLKISNYTGKRVLGNVSPNRENYIKVSIIKRTLKHFQIINITFLSSTYKVICVLVSV